MRLRGERADHCPVSRNPRILGCVHCKDPPCARACPVGAIVEVGFGIYTVDEERCTGCGKCVEACPYGAIVMEDGKAKKCNLCYPDFDPLCVRFDGVKVEYTQVEKEEMWENLGWNVKEKRGLLDMDLEPLNLQESRIVKVLRKLYAGSDLSLDELIENYMEESGVEMEEERLSRIRRFLELDLLEYGPFTPYVNRDDIEEVACVGLHKPLYVYHTEMGWVETNVYFTSLERFVDMVNRLIRESGRRLTLKNPRVNVVLPNGSRVHAAIPPVAISGPEVTVRNFKTSPLTPYDLVASGTVSLDLMAVLWALVLMDNNVLISGNTGSGKTTLLNALLLFLPPIERIVMVEETPEISLPHPHVVRLTVVDHLDIGLMDLVRDTLRMRPDRVVVGEVRHEGEVRALMDTMMAGQGRGSYATIHGRSIKETRERLRSMGILEGEIGSIDVMINMRRWTEGKRLIRRVVEVEWRGKNVMRGVPEEMVALMEERFGKDPLETMGSILKEAKGVRAGVFPEWSWKRLSSTLWEG